MSMYATLSLKQKTKKQLFSTQTNLKKKVCVMCFNADDLNAISIYDTNKTELLEPLCSLFVFLAESWVL